jgi:2,3-dihydroxybenzoate decarboxylase
VTYIALEEAFAIPELAARQPQQELRIPVSPDSMRTWSRRLVDFDEYRLPEMDANGIDLQVLSLTAPGIEAARDARSAVENAVFANDHLAGVVERHPNRFRGFAAVPLQDPAAAVRELERCVRELGFVGALVNGHTHGRFLDDPVYEDVWSTLEELQVPLYLHPGWTPTEEWRVMRGRPEMNGASWSWQAETGGHAMRLVYAGVFDRHPAATLILGHLGEFLSFQRSRFDSRYRTLELKAPLQRMPSEYFGSNIAITTTGVLAPEAVQAAVLTIGEDAVMFSIDYPYESTAEAVASIENADLSPEQKEKIGHRNARRILGLTDELG